ncbi:MAG TPA: hypothetical protein VFX12_02180 [Vicinamibacterales bacterium]|nr:hypothetical protein [Vicinamibacterales bacterium]
MEISRRLTIAAAWLLVAAGPLAAQTSPRPSGHWTGTIEIPDHEMPLTVDLARSATGAWIGSLSIPSSTSIDVPLDTVAVDGGVLTFTARVPEPASFEGRLSADGTMVSGTASNQEGSAPFALERHGEADVKVPPPSSLLTNAFAGTWQAAPGAGGARRSLVLTLAAAADGRASATLVQTSRNQQIPVTTVTIDSQQITFESRAVSGTFRGTLGPGGAIAGEWTQGGTQVPLTFVRVSAPPSRR